MRHPRALISGNRCMTDSLPAKPSEFLRSPAPSAKRGAGPFKMALPSRTAFFALLLASLASSLAFAQEQLFLFDGTNETAVGAITNLPDTAPGDTLHVRFHIRNSGSAAIQVNTITIGGTGFSLSSFPDLPYTLAPGGFVEIDVAFAPLFAASYSATLQVDELSTILAVNAITAVSVTVDKVPLMSGMTVDFGRIVQGASVSKTFTLSNSGTSSITVNTISVSGDAFQFATTPAVPLQLGPGATVSFQVVFHPTTAVADQGALHIDQRTFVLTGTGYLSALPAATISFDNPNPVSGAQVQASIQLASAPQSGATGTLTLSFQPSVQGVTDDPAITFLTGNPRVTAVQINSGDATVHFGSANQAAFQTGTTAGVITFTLTLTNTVAQTRTITVAPAMIGLDLSTVTRLVNALNVSISGFDNTYSASQLSFTFYDKTGKAVQPGAIDVNAAVTFQQYFKTTTAGGSFSLLAQFPIFGDATQITGADVSIANSVGTTHTARLTF